jgi:hypothetical protein
MIQMVGVSKIEAGKRSSRKDAVWTVSCTDYPGLWFGLGLPPDFRRIQMALGWLTVLKMVPWGDVIENAPKVASGAKKLWQTVGKKPVSATSVVSEVLPAASPAVAALQREVAGLRLTVADLHQQMLVSTELIQSLADQNTQLIKRVEVNRVRLLWLAAWLLGLSVALGSRFF